ncbi:O-antigen ligase family protein [Cytobacillus suaedae]|nr:O-antigen ligase family protein [Cytobacillus suaedae]
MHEELYKAFQRDVESDLRESRKIDKILFYGLLLLVAIIPLIVRATIMDYSSPVLKNTLLETGPKGDVFTYYKFTTLMVFTIILMTVFLYKMLGVGYVISNNKLNIFLLVMFTAIIISLLLAPYKSLALKGFYNRYDGTLTYICYLVLFFISANIVYNKKRIYYLLYSLVPFIIINAMLGVALLFNYNVLELSWVNSLIYSGLPDGATIGENSKLLTTINNGNYISGFGGVLFAIFFTKAVLGKNIYSKIVDLVISIFSFSMILTSLSTSGFLTSLLAFLLILIVSLRTKRFISISIVVFSFIISSSMLIYTYSNHNPSVWNESIGVFFSENPFIQEQTANMIYNGEVRGFVKDLVGTNQVSADDDVENINDFELPTLPEPGTAAGSGRLYIWEKTIDLINKKPLTGYGLDTLAYFFPQDDPQKIASLMTSEKIVDKPHNMYVGIAFGSGLIAIIGLIGLISVHIYNSLRFILLQRIDSGINIVFLSLFIGWFAYLIQALFNDSVVGSATVFWILFGVSVSIYLNKNTVKDSSKIN